MTKLELDEEKEGINGEIWNRKIHLSKRRRRGYKNYLYSYMKQFFPNAKLEYFT